MIRLVVFGFLFLCVVYVLVSIYSQSIRREKLEDKWDGDIKTGDRDEFIRAGMKTYHSSLRKKLIVLVFIMPCLIVAATVYFVNFQ